MKKVFDSSEITHIWAKQSQDEGRTSGRNIYFVGPEIFSYGRHFCMGKILPANVVLITTRKYSNTTAKHLASVRYAVNHMERVYIPYPEGTLKDQAKTIISEIQNQLSVISNTRKKPDTKERAKNELRSIVANVDRYCEVTNQKLSTRWDFDRSGLQKEFNLYLNAARTEQGSEQLADKLNKLAIAQKKAETVRQKRAIAQWLKGDSNHYLPFSDKVYLRAGMNSENIEVVQTSRGASAPLKAAKVLFSLIHAGKDVKGFDLDGYTVISMNGVLTIGCHKIERDEIERFAKTQGWL